MATSKHRARVRHARIRRDGLELQISAIVGQPSRGMITVAEADNMIFGYALPNEWSARDIQATLWTQARFRGRKRMQGAHCWSLAAGETRTFLEDGDILTLRGVAPAKTYRLRWARAWVCRRRADSVHVYDG